MNDLAYLLYDDKQLDAAEEAALQTINLLSDTNYQYIVCDSYHLLGYICHSKGEGEKAIEHYKAALGIASPSSWHSQLSWIHYSLAVLLCNQGRFNDAHAHIEHAKSYAASDIYLHGHAMQLWANIWYLQGRLREAKSEAISAFDVYQKLRALKDVEDCQQLLQQIEEAVNGEFVRIVLYCMPIHHLFLA